MTFRKTRSLLQNTDKGGATLARTLMDCTLFIPHLLPPRELADALWRTVDAPQLKSMLARAVMTSDATMDAQTWLCRRFGIARQQDFPLAPLLAHREKLVVDNGYWLCATPVHLETRRNALVLGDPEALAITTEESAAFAATLAAHLREENVTLHAPQPNRWFLRCDATPALTTTSLATATSRDVRPFLPQGADSARWHRILTEIQMLLHAHPLNDAREARGLPPVNSVWLWGGGTFPAPSPKPFDTVWSHDATVHALAHHGGCHIETAPTRFDTTRLTGTSHFFSFELLETRIRLGDVQAWSNAVTALERDWFSPLRDALQSASLDALTLVTTSDAGMRQFVIRHRDHFKFWRKNKYLS